MRGRGVDRRELGEKFQFQFVEKVFFRKRLQEFRLKPVRKEIEEFL